MVNAPWRKFQGLDSGNGRICMMQDQSSSTGPHSLKIGVFDSGLGGLSVLASLMDTLPGAGFLYFGDTANAPYGDRSPDWVRARSLEIYHHFVEQGVSAMVIACNSATSAAVSSIREIASIPILGIEPALKTAVESNTSAPIAVLATAMTIRGPKLQQLIGRFPDRAGQIFPIACPGLADLVEAGAFDAARDYLQEKVRPQLPQGSPSPCVVLGCTHYAFLKSEIRAVFGADTQIHDGSLGLARHLARLLDQPSPPAPAGQATAVDFIFTRDQEKKLAIARAMLSHASLSAASFQP